ncbi:MAG: transglycosylase SLT domain-containing protein [Tissierellia bacterium]|nr:transglycosylase SLT domain-containing protein [Tissierellia bacterium]
MKIFKTTVRRIILTTLILLQLFNSLVFAGVNPPREEIEQMIEKVAEKRAIPSVLLKSIARVESVYEHYRPNGTPKINGTNIGLMQVCNKHGGYDSEKLKYNIEYNIEAGADVLLNKWSMSSYQSVSSVGNMDPNILENWYFALWAYNGWAQSNNPNMLSNYAKKYTYQQLIYNIAEEEYSEKINNIDFSYLPSSGRPSRSLVVPTPAHTNSGKIVLYEKGDYVRTDGVGNSYHLRDNPAGKYIHELGLGQLAIIVDGPVLEKGYYWYKVSVDSSTEGWIERNWLLRTGDIDRGRYIFEDISFHWARKIIMDLYGKNIVSEAEYFHPDNFISKEEYCIMLNKSLEYADIDKESIKDRLTDEVNTVEENLEISGSPVILANLHPWAVEHIESIYEIGLVAEEDLHNPLGNLTRKEAALMVEKMFEIDEEYTSLDIESIFIDIDNLSEEEVKAIKVVYTNGLMSGKSQGRFNPEEFLTRAEAAVIMDKVSEKLN